MSEIEVCIFSSDWLICNWTDRNVLNYDKGVNQVTNITVKKWKDDYIRRN